MVINDRRKQFGLGLGGHAKFQHLLKNDKYPEGRIIARTYSPISDLHQRSHVDFLIKNYKGDMTNHLFSLSEGD